MKSRDKIYCLALCPDWETVIGHHGLKSRFICLDRAYKPWASVLTGWGESYDDCPGTRLWLDEKFLRAIHGGSTPCKAGDSRCWLYHDGTRTRHADYQQRHCKHAETAAGVNIEQRRRGDEMANR